MDFFNCTVPNFLYMGNDPKRTHEKYETALLYILPNFDEK